jgi:hypothetical protein
LKLQAFQAVQEDFEAQHPGEPEVLRSTEKRMEYGKEMMSEDGWRFLCSEFDNKVSTQYSVNKSLTREAGIAVGLISTFADNQDLFRSLFLNDTKAKNQEL